MKTYIVKYGNGGVEKCRGKYHLADFLHHLCLRIGVVKATIEIEDEALASDLTAPAARPARS